MKKTDIKNIIRILLPVFFIFLRSDALLFAQFSGIATNGIPITYFDFENGAALQTLAEQQINSGNTFDGKTLGGIPDPNPVTGLAGAGSFFYGGSAGIALTSSGWDPSQVDPGIAATYYYQFSINTTGFTGIFVNFDLLQVGMFYPFVGFNYSTDGLTYINVSTPTTVGNTNTWYHFRNNASGENGVVLSAAADNNPNLKIRIYGYAGVGTTLNNELRIDNLRVLATGTVASAGTKTTLIEPNIYASYRSQSPSTSVYARTGTFDLNGPGTTLELGSNINFSGTFNVNSGATLDCGSAVSYNFITNGTFNLNAGGTLIVRDNAGITTGATGNIQTTTRNYNAGANYTYAGFAAQATGNGLPATLSGNLTVNNGSGVSVTSTAQTVNGILTLTNGALIMPASSTLTLGGAINITSGTFSGNTTSSMTINGSGAITGNISFAAGGQQLNNFTLDRAGTTFTLATPLSVAGNWTNNGTFSTSQTVTFNGSAASVTISGISTTPFANVVINKSAKANVVDATAVISMSSGGLTLTTGTFKVSSASTITPFSGTVIVFSTAAYILNHAGAVSNWGSTGSLVLNGDLTIANGTMNVGAATGDLVSATGAAVITIQNGALNVMGRVYLGGGTYTQSGGNVNVCTTGINESSNAAFEAIATTPLTMSGGAIVLVNANSGAGGDFKMVTGSGTKTFTGGAVQAGNAFTAASTVFQINSPIPLFNFTVNNTNTPKASISGNDLTVNNQLTLNGQLLLNNQNLILGAGAPAVTGTLDASNGMIVCNGTGEARKLFNANGSFVFPVGEITGVAEYSPFTLNFTSGTYGAGAYGAVRVTNAKHPANNSAVDYLNRYWDVTSSNITSFSCDVTGNYVIADIAGNESNIATGKYDSALPWTKYGAVNTVAHTISATVSSFSAFSGITLAGPSVNITGAAFVCPGGSSVLTANPAGDTPFTYLWSTSEMTASITVTPPSATTYTVTVTDANGFTGTNTFTVSIFTPPTATCSGTNVSCFGANDGTASVTPSSGQPGYTFLWSTASTDDNISGLSPGTYTVTVTDANGCTGTCTYTVTQPAALDVTCSKTDASCFGGNDGTATAAPADGTAPYTYLWSNNETTSAINSLSAGTYTVTVTDANGCIDSCSVTVGEPSVITAVASNPNISCNGGNGGSASVTPSGGTPPYTYLWSNAATTSSATGLASGNYTVTVTDANGCSASDVAVVDDRFISADAGIDISVCERCGVITLASAMMGGAADTAYYTIVPSPNDGNYLGTGTLVNGNPVNTSYYIPSPGDAGHIVTLQLTAHDNSGVCSDATDNVELTIHQNPQLVTTPLFICAGGTVDLINGVSDANGTAGTFTFYNSLADAQNGINGFAAPGTVSSAGTYFARKNTSTVPVCYDIDSIIVNQNNLSLTVGSNSPVCSGETIYLASSPSGGMAPYTYSWSGPAGFSSTDQNPFIPSAAVSNTGTYYLTVTDANGCMQTDSVEVTVSNCTATLNLKFFVEGYYTGGGMMNPALFNQGVAGSTATDADTVIIELRNPSSPYSLAETFTGVLQTDGNIACTFPGTVTGNSYFIAILHRSAVQTWSASPVTLSTVTNYDFSTAAAQAYGSNMTDTYSEGIWSLYTGDINQDQNVDLLDFSDFETDINNGIFGYYATDLNGDGNVDLLDFATMETNINNGIFSDHPN